MNCYRHPDRQTRRKCYQCKTAICAECQVKLDHHYFCSEPCHQKWRARKAEKARKKLEKKPRKPNQPAFDPETKIGFLETRLGEITGEHQMLELKLRRLEYEQRSRSRKLLIAGGVAGVMLLILVLVLGGYFLVHQPEPQPDARVQASAPESDPGYPGELSETVFLEPPSLELPPGEIALEQGRINLYGRAPGASRAVLLVNGRERASQNLSRPEFVFREIELAQGTNLIQALSEDEKGNQSLSIAQMVEYPEQGPAQAAYTPGLDYTHGPRDFSGLALTFDAGGNASSSARMLEILRGQGVKATIFVTGRFIKDHPDLVRQMVEDGHEIGNHTYSHPHLTTWESNSRQWTAPGVTKEFVQAELLNTAQLFKETTASELARLWRAPYGEHNPEIRKWAEEVGFYHIGWSRTRKMNYDLLDWLCDPKSKYYRTPEQIRTVLTDIARTSPADANGAILLMHLSTDRGEKFPDQVLLPALEAFNARGYRIVKVSELLPGLLGK